jgi:hypothetical protein
MAATAVIAVFGFQFWQTQSEKNIQIAMVAIEDRGVLFESQVRRASESKVQAARAPSLLSSRGETSGGERFQEFDAPTSRGET